MGGEHPGGEQLAGLLVQCASLEGSLAALVQRVEKNEREPPTPVTERAVKHDVSLLVDAVQASMGGLARCSACIGLGCSQGLDSIRASAVCVRPLLWQRAASQSSG